MVNLYHGINSAINPDKQNRDDYLPKDIADPCGVSRTQKKLAKEAIFWLLSKAPHTIDEIAEHFGLSPMMVESLIKEFIRSGKLIKDDSKKTISCLESRVYK